MEKATLKQVISLIDQLSPDEQMKVVEHLQSQGKIPPVMTPLTFAERQRLFSAMQIDSEVIEEPSPRREDWYGDDGR